MMSKLCDTNKQRGAALVEFALILPILLMLFLGTIEFGVVMMHELTLQQVAREGSREASLGRPVATIQARMLNLAGALPNHNELTIDLKYSTDQGLTYPNTVGDVGGGSDNSAPAGSLVKVTTRWPHHMIFGGFFSPLLHGGSFDKQNNTLMLGSDMVMRRE